MYVQHNNEVCATTAAMEKQYVLHILRVHLTSGIQHAMSMHHIVFCGPSSPTVLFHTIS